MIDSLIAALLVAATPVPALSPAPSPADTQGAPLAIPANRAMQVTKNAIISSANGPASERYLVVVWPDGHADVVGATAPSQEAHVSRQSAGSLFFVLSMVGPLDKLHVRSCRKTTSTASGVRVMYKGIGSPDLSCGGDRNVAALTKTVDDIIAQVGIKKPPAHRAPSE